MKMFKKGSSKNNNINRQYEHNKPGHVQRNNYVYRTCSVCGKELSQTSKHICDSCAWFLRQKHIADL